MPLTPKQDLDAHVAQIIETNHPKKLIVAGAGAGKTFTFSKLLAALPASAPERRLVITFLGGLKGDLEKDLGAVARVQTFHGYCFALLKQKADIREASGFTDAVRYFPRIVSLIKRDWELASDKQPTLFVPALRQLAWGAEVDFFLARGSYYDAIGYDDGAAHLVRAFSKNDALIPDYDLVIVDEVQDLNGGEVALIDLLASRSNLVVAGDDDQALYGGLRDASEEHIRQLNQREDFLSLNLPYCMRCPSVVVKATNDILNEADAKRILGARIKKRYDPFPRETLDNSFPAIRVVETTTASLFGRYIEREIRAISAEEIAESHAKGFPTVLIIGSKPYSTQVKEYLEERGITIETKAPGGEQIDDPFVADDYLSILSQDPQSNLGWRIALEVDQPAGLEEWVRLAVEAQTPLRDLIEGAYRTSVEEKVAQWQGPGDEPVEKVVAADEAKPTIRLTSFEGAKGMSAQRVFVLGLHKKTSISATDVRRMAVAITRTRRQCYLLRATLAFSKKGAAAIRPSVFLDWISEDNLTREAVSAATFGRKSAKPAK